MLFLGRGLDTDLKLDGYCKWEHYRYCPLNYDIIRCGYLYSGWLEYPCDIIYKQKMEEIRKMKEKTLYYCEKCGTAYARKKDAFECETYHKIPKEIVPEGYTFKPKKVGPAWPYRIRVKDEKGNTCEYIYNGHEG